MIIWRCIPYILVSFAYFGRVEKDQMRKQLAQTKEELFKVK